jgi:hypothetical protein
MTGSVATERADGGVSCPQTNHRGDDSMTKIEVAAEQDVEIGQALAEWQRNFRPQLRNAVLKAVLGIAPILVLISIYLAYRWQDGDKTPAHKHYAYFLVGAWVIGPPLYFLAEYWLLPPYPGFHDERVRHQHDLGRNIWLALVVILTAITGVSLSGLG